MCADNQEFIDFVQGCLDRRIPLAEVALRHRSLPYIKEALVQIECRQRTTHKLPSFIGEEHFYFPTVLSSEQATHELVAHYHASLVGKGHSVCDMTAGLGIDSMTFAKNGCDVTAIEYESPKTEALSHNASVLGLDTLTAVNADSVQWLAETDRNFDVIFADPARRDGNNRRTHLFADCTPDITGAADIIFRHTDTLLVKGSPLLDVDSVARSLPHVAEIHIVCVKGECKEVLAKCVKGSTFTKVITVDIRDKNTETVFEVHPDRCGNSLAPVCEGLSTGQYLHEPNAALMKIRCDAEICRRFPGLTSISANTHLLVGDKPAAGFPGRVLEITGIPGKGERKRLKGSKGNVCVRNYPEGAEALKKKLGVSDGGDTYIYGIRDNHDKPCIMICKLAL